MHQMASTVTGQGREEKAQFDQQCQFKLYMTISIGGSDNLFIEKNTINWKSVKVSWKSTNITWKSCMIGFG